MEIGNEAFHVILLPLWGRTRLDNTDNKQEPQPRVCDGSDLRESLSGWCGLSGPGTVGKIMSWPFFLHKFLLFPSYFLISKKCVGHSMSSCFACSSFIYFFQCFLGVNNKTHTSNTERSLRFKTFSMEKHKWIILNSTFWRLKSII